MFERFTGDARTAVVQAQEHARRLGHRYIGCEHLLLAAASTGEPASAALREHGVTPEGVEIIFAGSAEPTAATDLEWPALILREDPGRLRGLRCEGLEWETPDFHAEEIISAGGLAAWTRATFDTPSMWAARLRLAAASGAALERVMGDRVMG